MRTLIIALIGLTLGATLGVIITLIVRPHPVALPLLGPGYAILSLLSIAPYTGMGMAAPRFLSLIYANACAYGLLGWLAGCSFPHRTAWAFARAGLAVVAGTVSGIGMLGALFVMLVFTGPEGVEFAMLLTLGIFIAAPWIGLVLYWKWLPTGTSEVVLMGLGDESS